MKNKILLAFILVCLSGTQLFATCQANFTWAQTSNNVITFTDASTGTSANTMYYWDFADGNYAYSQNPVHTFNVPGVYNVCLTIGDSAFMGPCSSTFCANVTVTGSVICNITLTFTSTLASCSTCADGTASATAAGGTPPYTYLWQTSLATTQSVTGLLPGTYSCCVTDANACTACGTVNVDTSSCQASFTWMQTSNNVISFTNTSIGNNPVSTFYYWTFGDANVSYSQNPVHNYNAPGTYYVCLQISDSAFAVTCSSTFCDSVVVTGVNCNNLSVSVTAVNASCSSCADGSATAAASGGTPPFSFLWNNSATTQTINNLLPGYYSCVITDALGCTTSAGASVYGAATCSAYFTLTPDILPHTYNAVATITGTPPFSYVWSWGDATYSYTAFPTHTYATAGWYTICLTITDTLMCTSAYCDSFNILRSDNSNTIITVHVVPSITGINNTESENLLTVFPNPASDKLIIDYTLSTSSNTDINVYDMLGNTLRSFNDDLAEGRHELILDIRDLKQGIYFMSLRTNEFVASKKIFVIK